MTTAALRGGRISATQVAVDAFGNALGDSIAGANGQSARTAGGQTNPYDDTWRSDNENRMMALAGQSEEQDYYGPAGGGSGLTPLPQLEAIGCVQRDLAELGYAPR